MPPVRRRNIGRRTRTASQRHDRRVNEADEERSQRLDANRIRISQARSIMTPEQRIQSSSTRSVGARAENYLERRQNRRPNVTIRYERLAFRYDPIVDYAADVSVNFGTMSTVCQHCNALRFRHETPGLCCASGKVKLPQLTPPPEPLASLLSGQDPRSKHFLENIQKYNSCFQMTSFGANIIQARGFNPTFKVNSFSTATHITYTNASHKHTSTIHNISLPSPLGNNVDFRSSTIGNLSSILQIQGQIHHRAGALLPTVNADHKFLQIYFLGNSDHEINQRCAISRAVKREIIAQLQPLLHEHNQLVTLFKTALEMMPSDDHKIVIRADKRPAGEHERRYNAPMLNEVAIVVVGENLESRDIVIRRRDGGNLRRIYETHRSYDALQYPLIFCRGEDGYHFLIKMINPVTGT